MAIATEIVTARFINIVSGNPLACSFPLYNEDEVEVVYGYNSLKAVLNTDYNVTLNPSQSYASFTITPLASLLTKINNLIASDPTNESNVVIVRTTTSLQTSIEPGVAKDPNYLSLEVDRAHKKLQELSEKVGRCIMRPDKKIGIVDGNLFISDPVNGKTLIWDSATSSFIPGPELSEIVDAQTNMQGFLDDANEAAAEAAASLAATQELYNLLVGQSSGIQWKSSVRVATTANITLSGTQTIDDIALNVDDAVLVKNQTASQDNGPYLVKSGAWIRRTDSDTWAELVSQAVAVEEGTVNEDQIFICTVNQGGTLGTTPVTYTTLGGGGDVYKAATQSFTGDNSLFGRTYFRNKLFFVDQPTYTLSSGGIVPERVSFSVSAGSGTTDTLKGIKVGGAAGTSPNGQWFVARATAGHTITVEHNSASPPSGYKKVMSPDGADFEINENTPTLMYYDNVLDRVLVISRFYDVPVIPASPVYKKALVNQATQQACSNGAYTTLQWDEVLDAHGMFDPGSNTRLTAPDDALYDLSCSLELVNTANGDIGLIMLVNGTVVAGDHIDSGATSSNTKRTLSVLAYPLDAGDYVEFQVYQQTGAGKFTTALKTRASIKQTP